MAPSIKGDLRIVLLGVTGAGKSASGNTILGRKAFKVDFSPASVTQKSEKEVIRKGNRNIWITDTPGLVDTEEKDVKGEIDSCMRMCAPGPHVFLLVIRADERFTAEKKNAVKWIQRNFGAEAARYTIILFTYIDELSVSLREHIEGDADLRQFLLSCGGQYHGFNNEDKDNHAQVDELLVKMDELVLKNYGSHYTNEMYEEVKRRIEEEKERQRRAVRKHYGPLLFGAVCLVALVVALKTSVKKIKIWI